MPRKTRRETVVEGSAGPRRPATAKRSTPRRGPRGAVGDMRTARARVCARLCTIQCCVEHCAGVGVWRVGYLVSQEKTGAERGTTSILLGGSPGYRREASCARGGAHAGTTGAVNNQAPTSNLQASSLFSALRVTCIRGPRGSGVCCSPDRTRNGLASHTLNGFEVKCHGPCMLRGQKTHYLVQLCRWR